MFQKGVSGNPSITNMTYVARRAVVAWLKEQGWFEEMTSAEIETLATVLGVSAKAITVALPLA